MNDFDKQSTSVQFKQCKLDQDDLLRMLCPSNTELWNLNPGGSRPITLLSDILNLYKWWEMKYYLDMKPEYRAEPRRHNTLNNCLLRWTNVKPTFIQRLGLQRRTNVKPTLIQRPVSDGREQAGTRPRTSEQLSNAKNVLSFTSPGGVTI